MVKPFQPQTTAAIDNEEAAIRVESVWAGYDGHTALEDVSFVAPRSSIVGLMGPNGSGKSTLLKVILGMHRPWQGRVRILGQEITVARRLLGYTPQTESVDWQFPVTVKDVVMMGRYGRLGPLRRPTGADREVVAMCLDRLQLTGMANRQIGELSGGQQRRVLIARALAQEPEVLLLDEPMAGLDAAIQHELMTLFEGLRDEGKTLLVATHDLSCTTGCFNRVLLLNKRRVAYDEPAKVCTEELLNEAFKSHLILLPVGKAYYEEHHGHD
jgi:manganese/iron transport system ATP-binding protein